MFCYFVLPVWWIKMHIHTDRFSPVLNWHTCTHLTHLYAVTVIKIATTMTTMPPTTQAIITISSLSVQQYLLQITPRLLQLGFMRLCNIVTEENDTALFCIWLVRLLYKQSMDFYAQTPNSITLAGSKLVRSWFEADSELKFGLSSSLLAAN